MTGKIIVQISEGIGNQLFMFANAYSLSKKLNYKLYLDNTSGYFKKKNLLRRHQKYQLNKLNINTPFAKNFLKPDNYLKYFIFKLLKYFSFIFFKNLLIEEKIIKIKKKKVAKFYSYKKNNFCNFIYLKGNFETEKYFKDQKKNLQNLIFKNINIPKKFFSLKSHLHNSNSVSIHFRFDRFSDQNYKNNNYLKSKIFEKKILLYNLRAIKFSKIKIKNPSFFIWTNNVKKFNQIKHFLKNIKYRLIVTNDDILDFYLFSYAKNFIVGPSSYHWWGAWLNKSKNKICFRPKDINPSNNLNFWPNDWISV